MPTDVMTLPKRLTKVETARRLGIPTRSVDGLIDSGRLKTVARIQKERAIVLESSVNELIAILSDDERQAS